MRVERYASRFGTHQQVGAAVAVEIEHAWHTTVPGVMAVGTGPFHKVTAARHHIIVFEYGIFVRADIYGDSHVSAAQVIARLAHYQV